MENNLESAFQSLNEAIREGGEKNPLSIWNTDVKYVPSKLWGDTKYNALHKLGTGYGGKIKYLEKMVDEKKRELRKIENELKMVRGERDIRRSLKKDTEQVAGMRDASRVMRQDAEDYIKANHLYGRQADDYRRKVEDDIDRIGAKYYTDREKGISNRSAEIDKSYEQKKEKKPEEQKKVKYIAVKECLDYLDSAIKYAGALYECERSAEVDNQFANLLMESAEILSFFEEEE